VHDIHEPNQIWQCQIQAIAFSSVFVSWPPSLGAVFFTLSLFRFSGEVCHLLNILFCFLFVLL